MLCLQIFWSIWHAIKNNMGMCIFLVHIDKHSETHNIHASFNMLLYQQICFPFSKVIEIKDCSFKCVKSFNMCKITKNGLLLLKYFSKFSEINNIKLLIIYYYYIINIVMCTYILHKCVKFFIDFI